MGNNTLACIAYGSVVYLHPLVVIGAPMHPHGYYFCATVQAASQREGSYQNITSTHSSPGIYSLCNKTEVS